MEIKITNKFIQKLKIRRPDDFHVHLRDKVVLEKVLPDTSKDFARALVMPNLVPPITKATDALIYRQKILDLLPESSRFTPLMTLYLTEKTVPQDVLDAFNSKIVYAFKLYPAGATTNSHSGVRDITRVRQVLDTLESIDMPLCVHGESSDPNCDIFDRERYFICETLERICRWNPNLKIVFEHITTTEALSFVEDYHPVVAGTITVHHLILNRSHMFDGGLRPHRFCFPVAKGENHRVALLQAALSGNSCFFLGTDSAPHFNSAKINHIGNAGIYSAPMALSCLAQLFDDNNAIEKLEDFVSKFGADFYRIPYNSDKIQLEKQSVPIPLPDNPVVENDTIEVFDPGFPIYWKVAA